MTEVQNLHEEDPNIVQCRPYQSKTADETYE